MVVYFGVFGFDGGLVGGVVNLVVSYLREGLLAQVLV